MYLDQKVKSSLQKLWQAKRVPDDQGSVSAKSAPCCKSIKANAKQKLELFCFDSEVGYTTFLPAGMLYDK